MSKSSSFKLSVQLEGHTADVRSVSATHIGDPLQSLLLSASRDGTGRVWSRPAGSKSKRELRCRHVLEGHEGFVNSCAWISREDAVLAVTGGQDRTINAYELPPPSTDSTVTSLLPNYTLLGHEDNVCALDVFDGPGSYIVSGSWDRTARVWQDWECKAVLSGHTQAVWAVLALTDDLVLTASADKMIRMYSIKKAASQGEKGSAIATFTSHTDAVRGLVRISETAFASCSNDGNIQIYPIPSSLAVSVPVQPIHTLSGHTSFVYSLATLSDGSLASSGEDRSVRIWKDGSLTQSITIPAISVWSVDGLANGDFVCASSDGAVRVFTRVEQRVADAETIEVYEATVSSQALNKTQVGDVQKENLPGAEELSAPGKEGQVKMIRVGELVEAHQYSTASSKWEKIGEVVGGVGSGQKKLYEGKEYDYVFDVDIADGVPPLKLPYNASENPYNAAHRFLERNELPLTYLDQVVGFIEKNTEAVNLGSSNEFVDPYTGASSYRPGGAGASAFTSTPAAPASASTPAPSVLPQRLALTFKQFNEQGAKAKIEELNGQLDGTTAMSAQELGSIQQLLPILSAVSSTSNAPSKPVGLDHLQAVISRWPLSHRFPLLDIYRLACSTNVQASLEPVTFALQVAQWSSPWPNNADEVKTRSTLSLLALRAVANAVSVPTSSVPRTQILSELAKGDHLSVLAKPARVAYATVLLNLSIRVGSGAGEAGAILELIGPALNCEKQGSHRDGEVIYRILIALGNLLVSSSGSLSMGALMKAKEGADTCVASSSEGRIKTIMSEIKQLSSLL